MIDTITKETLKKIHQIIEEKIEQNNLTIAYEVYGIDRTLLSYFDPKLSLDKVNWINRKRNVVLAFGQSSSAIAEKNQYDMVAFCEKYAYSNYEMTLTAGAVPILNKEGYMLGVLTVTGLLPEEDHALALEIINQL